MDTSKLKELIDLMNRHELEELELESEGFKVRLRKKAAVQEYVTVPAPSTVRAGGHASSAGSADGKPVLDDAETIRSPMVGTFYHAPDPEAEPFVSEGDRIVEGKVLCIIEAMKVMNEIKAEVVGTIEEILVSNGESVEYGQPLFRISA